MKNLSKLIAVAFTASALFLSTNVKAQTSGNHDWRFGIGAEVAVPTGQEHDQSNIAVGGTARLQYGLSPTVALTLTSGFIDILGKENPNDPNGGKYLSIPIVPVKVGIKDFVSQNVYLGLEGGAGFVTNNGNVKVIGAPAIGYASKSWDVALHYDQYFGTYQFGTLGLRLAYAFPLSK